MTLPSKRMGIYNLQIKECGCRVKSYIGGKVVIEGCENHDTEVYHVCPSCSKIFKGDSNHNGQGKKEMKQCVWSHAQ